jgi:long-subunit acyl-CoA synthetase (AMP-forming)
VKTLMDYVYEHEELRGDRPWLTQPMGGGILRQFTWREAIDESRRMAAYLKGLGLEPGSRIAIISKNCAWWFLADLATWMAGHVSVPVYPTLTADSVRAILDHSGARVAFVGKLDQFESMEAGIPSHVARIGFPLSPNGIDPAWNDIIARHAPIPGKPNRDPDELATIMYTSGSTGAPKGVMHSFRTMDHSRAIIELSAITPGERFISYLPLAHVAERALLEATTLMVGYRVWFVESLQTFVADVQRARPTVFGSVPRLWMQFQAGVHAKVPPARLARLLRVPLVRHFVRRKVLRGLGLDQARVCFYGSAPTPVQLIEWYRSLGLELVEIYGMTEGWAYSHMGRVESMRPGWVGPPVAGVEQRLTDEGEVLVQTPGLMLGYYQAPELTSEMIDTEGWLHTGDRGEIDEAGRLRITGRVKDLFKTSKGKYVAPAPIENRLLAHPHVEQACVTGEAMPQPCAIVVLNARARAEASANQDEVRGSLESLLDEINETVDAHERLHTIVVSTASWTVENDLLTPTLKLKRSAIEAHYAPGMAAWYTTGERVIWA